VPLPEALTAGYDLAFAAAAILFVAAIAITLAVLRTPGEPAVASGEMTEAEAA
jgi:hypothetical protein